MKETIKQKTAKQLKEWGCDIKSIDVYVESDYPKTGKGVYQKYHYYDIIITHAKEFFGNGYINGIPNQYRHPVQCLVLLQEGNQKEADQYILSNTVFNPKNK